MIGSELLRRVVATEEPEREDEGKKGEQAVTHAAKTRLAGGLFPHGP